MRRPSRSRTTSGARASLPGPLVWELDTPQAFDEATADATPEEVAATVQVSADPARHLAKLAELAELGFDRIFLHHVGVEQDAFLDTFGEHVVPTLKAAGR